MRRVVNSNKVEYEYAMLTCDNCGKVFERTILKDYHGLVLCDECIENTSLPLKLVLAANKFVKSLLMLGLFISPFLLIYVLDWGWLRGAITEYPVLCPADFLEGNGCYALNTTTYLPNKYKQVVVMQDDFDIRTLTKCTVINRKNWQCKWDDESAVFGFNKGQFSDVSLTLSPGEHWDDSIKRDMEYRYVPRFIYLLEQWNII
jgi:hypothetical protein